jgi:hypothetical protein
MAILNLCQVLFYISVFGKMEKGAGRSTWRVLLWHEVLMEYLEGTAEEVGGGHV